MPHSSGGGSHSGGYHSSSSSGSSSRSSGGSHSGGYHSSSSSGYSSRSSGGSHSGGYHSSSSYQPRRSAGAYAASSNSPVHQQKVRPSVSRTGYTGARRYVYYRDHQPQYVYSDYQSIRRPKRKGVLWGWLIFTFLLFCGFVDIFTPPDKLKTDYDCRMVVEDSAGVLEQDGDALQAAMNAFFDKTGIMPSVITVNQSDWQQHYKTLNVYALDQYMLCFSDERHWLLVYSAAQPDETGFIDWQWEGIQGDETDKILTAEVADAFGMTLTKCLMAPSRYSVAGAMTAAFDAIMPKLMQAESAGKYSILTPIIIIGFFVFIAFWHSGYIQFGARRPAALPRDAVAAPETSHEVTCDYCTGVYLNDRHKCPYCGAPKHAAGQ